MNARAEHDPMTAALDYGEARRVQLVRRRQLWPLRCEWRDYDTAPCWMRTSEEVNARCEACQKRASVYPEWRAALKAEKAALRKLQRALERAFEGR